MITGIVFLDFLSTVFETHSPLINVPEETFSFPEYTVCLKSKCTDFPMDELEM
jgi:hypothetical protein